MVHDCTDWTTSPPSRKTPVLILSYGESHWYTSVPRTFEVLEELAREKFDLGTSDIEFHSSCLNLCNDVSARIDDGVWEDIAPYIGCIRVVRKSGSRRTAASQSSFKFGDKLKGGKSNRKSSDSEEPRVECAQQ